MNENLNYLSSLTELNFFGTFSALVHAGYMALLRRIYPLGSHEKTYTLKRHTHQKFSIPKSEI
jgi:hypothetical protein